MAASLPGVGRGGRELAGGQLTAEHNCRLLRAASSRCAAATVGGRVPGKLPPPRRSTVRNFCFGQGTLQFGLPLPARRRAACHGVDDQRVLGEEDQAADGEIVQVTRMPPVARFFRSGSQPAEASS